MIWTRMGWTRNRALIAASSAVAVAVVAVGAGLILSSPAAHRQPAAKPTPTASPSASPPKASGPLRSPFTGERVKSLRPVLAVKIDNIIYARPQTGLTHADIVYVLPVEGGLSRFMAIFSSHTPPVVGPVRSARQDDLQILRQFGRPAFAYSGAQTRLLHVVEHAHIEDLYAGLVGGYYRDYQRSAPDNLYASTSRLLSEAKHASHAHNIGFTFASAAPRGGRPAKRISVSYPAASFTFTWSATKKRWLVWMDGARAGSTEGPQLSAPTVVIQHTVVGTSGFIEDFRRPPDAHSTGSGTAIVLRNGRAYKVHWSRPNAKDGTTFTMPDGRPMPFALGPVWIVLTGNRTNESG
jgi:hypothetical protein